MSTVVWSVRSTDPQTDIREGGLTESARADHVAFRSCSLVLPYVVQPIRLTIRRRWGRRCCWHWPPRVMSFIHVASARDNVCVRVHVVQTHNIMMWTQTERELERRHHVSQMAEFALRIREELLQLSLHLLLMSLLLFVASPKSSYP